MASTTVRDDALPAWAERLRNWLITGQYERLEWNTDAPEPSARYRLHEWIESVGESLLCALFGHKPLSETDLAVVRTALAATLTDSLRHTSGRRCGRCLAVLPNEDPSLVTIS